jgi:hypothetical protein
MTQPDAAQTESSEESVYEVESIVRHRVRKGQLQYFLKWKGYPSSQNTWENDNNVVGCQELIDAYWTSQESPKRPVETPSVPQKVVIPYLNPEIAIGRPRRILGLTEAEDGTVVILADTSAGLQVLTVEQMRREDANLLVSFLESHIEWGDPLDLGQLNPRK